jgi:23S rRNA (cytidine1920-2'-O)/16S rRNA (cytidine1409-2'-O)-methyltransferase
LGRKHGTRLRKLTVELAHAHPDIGNPEDLIAAGRVLVNGRAITNPSSLVPAGASIVISNPTQLRGEAKLRAALFTFAIDVAGCVALDLGAAAGGFTRALLEAGASRVYAVDAGYGQLLGSLRQDPRVVNLERVNLGELDFELVPDVVQLITIDLSYLSVARAVRQLEVLRISPDADLVALVKPMFELGLAGPPRTRRELARAVKQAKTGLIRSCWKPVASMKSAVEGGRGAVEFLVHARRALE